jgi:hypothetical protein
MVTPGNSWSRPPVGRGDDPDDTAATVEEDA